MGNATFIGGVHPYDGKDLSKDKPTITLSPTSEMVFPMAQHIGAPAKPVVAVGDAVLVGQCIGEASGFVSANIISSVSGKVKMIEPRLTASGAKVLSVVITNDGEYKTVEGFGKKRDPKSLSSKEILDMSDEIAYIPMTGKAESLNAGVAASILMYEVMSRE